MDKRELLEEFLEAKEEDCPGWCEMCRYIDICDTIEILWKRIQEKEKWEEEWGDNDDE